MGRRRLEPACTLQKRDQTRPRRESISNAIFSGSNALPTIVSWATNNKNAKDSQSIYNRLKKKRPDAKKQTPESKTLFQAPLKDSALGGVQIGSNQKLERLWNYFHRTVSKKINQNLDKLPWQDRSKKK